MVAGSLVGAAATALFWCWVHSRPATMAGVIVVAHGVVGIGLALGIGPLLRRCDRGTRLLAGASLAFLALGVAPAIATAMLPWDASGIRLLIASAAIAAIGALLTVTGARLAGRAGVIGAIAVGVAGLAAVARVLPAVMPMRPVAHIERDAAAPRQRVALIGIDGGDWSVIDPMLAAGELPNLAALRARGATAVLHSIDPLYSPVVWSSIFSGKTPEKHGITGWYVAYAANRRAAMLWEILAQEGVASVVVNVPGSWPPVETNGALVSGFPIPSVLQMPSNGETQLLGHIVAERTRPGSVPTALARRDGDALVASIDMPEPEREPRGAWRHFAIERLLQRGHLVSAPRKLVVRMRPAADGRRLVEVGEQRFELAPNAWTPWIQERAFDVPVHFRVRALDEGLYVSPFFQDPDQPVHPYASAPAVQSEVAKRGMYVVEGTGWRIADDPAVRDALFEHLVDVEEQHVGAALGLAAERDWSLFATVITITDRISHAFWPYRDPKSYGLDPSSVRPADAARVEDAYRQADAQLGRIVAALGDDVTFFVISDHGFRSDPPELRGNHRFEGIWIAAGPGIEPRAERGSLSVLDVTPTILAGMGLPVAADMDGRDVLGGVGPQRVVESYEARASDAGVARKIDGTTEEQLRSLGYVE